FSDVVLPRFEVTDVTVRQEEADWIVEATVHNRGSGDVDVEVALVSATGELALSPGEFAEGELVSVRLTTDSSSTVRLKTAQRPNTIMVDPFVKVLQQDREDAIKAIHSDTESGR
ncbi:MAG: hypothetical protein KDD65_11655, partial [Bacteroidetes bacterium]|nr:hypothetical protein [Bacteroidota bacterium]